MSEKQAHLGGRKATEATARPSLEITGLDKPNTKASLETRLRESSRLKRKSSGSKTVDENEDAYLTDTQRGLVNKCRMAALEYDIISVCSTADNPLKEMLSGILSCLEELVASRSPRSLSKKRAKELGPEQLVKVQSTAARNRSAIDIGIQTDIPAHTGEPSPMEMDPHPERQDVRKGRKKGKKRNFQGNKPIASTLTAQTTPSHPDDGPDTVGTEKTAWSQVVGRRVKRPHAKPAETTTAKNPPTKPAAVLVKVGDGLTFEEAVRAARSTNMDFDQLGTYVISMRKTQKSDLLIELTKGHKSDATI